MIAMQVQRNTRQSGTLNKNYSVMLLEEKSERIYVNLVINNIHTISGGKFSKRLDGNKILHGLLGLLNEHGPNAFFCFFINLMGTSFVQICIKSNTRVHFVTNYKRIWCPNPFAPAIKFCKEISHAAQLLLHYANNAARTQIHYYYICQRCGSYRQGYGRIDVDSLLKRGGHWRHGPRCSKCSTIISRVAGLRGFLTNTQQNFSITRRVYPSCTHYLSFFPPNRFPALPYPGTIFYHFVPLSKTRPLIRISYSALVSCTRYIDY